MISAAESGESWRNGRGLALARIRHGNDRIHTTAAPASVIANSVADVSFLAGMLIDKFCYHLPLYRQHQRLAMSGITVSRSTLTQQVKTWCDQQRQRMDLAKSSPLLKALGYVAGRQAALEVFLGDPDVPIDTNHLERALRPIPMGARAGSLAGQNWVPAISV